MVHGIKQTHCLIGCVYERVTSAQELAVSEISGDVNRTMEKVAEDDSNEDCKFQYFWRTVLILKLITFCLFT